jgi:hypothetical protein
VPLIGGQSICLYVHKGTATALVTSTIPYVTNSHDDQACKSASVKLNLKPGDKHFFNIQPKTENAAYVCGWSLSETVASAGLAR